MKYGPSSLCAVIVTALVAGGAITTACSSDTPDPVGSSGSSGDAGGEGGGGIDLSTPSIACADSIDSIYGDPGPLTAENGSLLKCAKDADLTKDAMQTKLGAAGYTGKPLTSNARVYRVSYVTKRGNAAKTPAVSSATVFIPDTPRGDKLPVVVAARGSRGQAAKCAVSKLDPSQEGINQDAYRLVYPLVGLGYAVILTDLAGYANFNAPGNPPSAYAQAEDVAYSTLDSGKALKKLFPSLESKVVLVGHSQGGHSALAALALSDGYPTAGPIVGAAVYAPLWLSQSSWAAVLYRPVGKDFPLGASAAGPVSVWYHYTHAELLDGPGEGEKLFAADKRAAIKKFVEETCWEGKDEELKKLGSFADELFDPAFAPIVAYPSVSGDCGGNAICDKWKARYSKDRPHLVGAAKSTPILLAYGGADDTIPPSRMRCALDRLSEDAANVTVCYEADKGHGTILSSKADYVSDWIASVALGAQAPAACPANASAITVACAVPPPND